MEPSQPSTAWVPNERSHWPGQADLLFEVSSLVLLVVAFCLFQWGGVSIVPLAILAGARIAIGQSRPMPQPGGESRHPGVGTRRRRQRRYGYGTLAVPFIVGITLGGILGWSELAYAVLAAGVLGAGTAARMSRIGTRKLRNGD